MKERIVQEIALLSEKYPSLQHGQNNDWVMIPDFNLFDGYNRQITKLLFLVKSTYPHTAPDNFYVESGLRLSNGNPPSSYTEGQGVAVPGNWGCFSWHPEIWRPSNEIQKGDNLLTFMRSVNQRLREKN